jgi:PEP-CTERM motif
MARLARVVTISIGLAITPLPTSAATLIGDVIAGSYDFPCVGCTLTGGFSYFFNPFVVTGPAAQTTLFLGNPVFYSAWNVYFTGNSLTLTMAPAPETNVSYIPDPFSGPVFTVLSGNSFGSITGVHENNPACVPCTPVTAFISGDSLYVNWQGAGGALGATIEVDFSVGGPVSTVPEPSTWILMLTGVALLGFAGYRGQDKNTAVGAEA